VVKVLLKYDGLANQKVHRRVRFALGSRGRTFKKAVPLDSIQAIAINPSIRQIRNTEDLLFQNEKILRKLPVR